MPKPKKAGPPAAVKSVAKKAGPPAVVKKSGPQAGVVAKSPAAVAAVKIADTELRRIGTEMLERPGQASFKVPDVLKDLKTAEKRAKELNQSRDGGEAELSALLTAMAEAKVYASERHKAANYDSFGTYAEVELEISRSKATQLVRNYRAFREVGLSDNHLGGKNAVSFTKFKELLPLIKNEVVTKRTVAKWLPSIRKEGVGALTLNLLRKQVAKAQPDPSERTKTVSRFAFALPPEQAEGFRNLLDAYKTAVRVQDDGTAFLRALNTVASAHVQDGGRAIVMTGLLGLRDMAARLAPVAPVYVALNESATFDKLGVHPGRLFAAFATGASPRFCLAESAAAAATHLGVAEDAVRDFPIELAAGLLPTAQFTGGVLEEAGFVDAQPTPEPVVESGLRLTAEHVGRTVSISNKGVERTVVVAAVNEATATFTAKPPRGRSYEAPFSALRLIDEAAPAAEPYVKAAEAEPSVTTETPAPAETPAAAAPKTVRTRKPKAEAAPVAPPVETTPDFTFESEAAPRPNFPLDKPEENAAYAKRVGAALLAAGKPAESDQLIVRYRELVEQHKALGAAARNTVMHAMAEFAYALSTNHQVPVPTA